jgi:hypothetical protein
MLIIPAFLTDVTRCPHCGSIHFRIIETMTEETYIDVNGKPFQTCEYGESYIECLKCHSKYPYTGNSIDGYFIDDGSGEHEPEFEQQKVQFNPFYRYSDYERGII